jgi:hypothetical protein
MPTYSIVQTVTVTADVGGHSTSVTLARKRVRVTLPAMESVDHEYAEMKLRAALGAIRKARWLYRRTYGKKAP